MKATEAGNYNRIGELKVTVRIDHEMEAVEAAAEAQNEGSFVRVAKTFHQVI
ncbi:MAG: hypothetical protein ACREDR_41060 [Blastocatellia bacterium]